MNVFSSGLMPRPWLRGGYTLQISPVICQGGCWTGEPSWSTTRSGGDMETLTWKGSFFPSSDVKRNSSLKKLNWLLVLERLIALLRSSLVKNVLVMKFNDTIQLCRRGGPLSRRWWRSPGAGGRPPSRRPRGGSRPWPARPAAETPGSDICCSSSQVSGQGGKLLFGFYNERILFKAFYWGHITVFM